MNDDGLRGRVFLVTGSGRGLGAALALAAGAEKARVVVNCVNDAKAAEAIAAEVVKRGGEALPVRADVADFEAARGLVEQVVAKWGRVDVLVNTVGAFNWNPVVEIEPDEWRRVVATNLDSVFHMCRLVVPHMREKRFGRIVNFAAVGRRRRSASRRWPPTPRPRPGWWRCRAPSPSRKRAAGSR